MSDAAKRTSTAEIEPILAWLAGPAAEDAQVELTALCSQLAVATAAPMPALQRLTVLELFQTRTNRVNQALKPLLLEASLPLSHRLRIVAQGLIEAHGALAAGLGRVLREGAPDKLQGPRRNQALLGAQLLGHLAEQQEVSLLVAAPPPPDLWRQAQATLRLVKDGLPTAALPPDIIRTDRTIKRMLALAACQPETCTPKEVVFLADYLRSFAGSVEIRFAPPAETEHWFWLAEERDGPPNAFVRRPPPAAADLLCFSCRPLAGLARQQLDRLAAGEEPAALGLPPAVADCGEALQRAAARWLSPPKRRSQRRRSSYRVQLCADLTTLWRILGGEGDGGQTAPLTDWMVLNESAGGFAMMHVAGDVSGIIAGAAVGVSAEAGPWRLCVVRWARSDNPEHVELGLELIAAEPKAVKVVWPAANRSGGPVPTLLIPSLPLLRRGETLLVPRGRYQGGRFTLISEFDDKIQFTECLAGDLAMQTARVDAFEFRRDFAPLGSL